jgi:tetratricopeptide (TPR) repeat protein
MFPNRIFVLCPDHDAPSGGIRRLYRHVDVLRRHHVEAAILHEKPGFRCSWFANDAQVLARSEVTLTPDDFLVVPEVFGPKLAGIEPGVPKVIFNQNAYLTFGRYPIEGSAGTELYVDSDVRAVFTVSQDNLAYLQYAFPQQRFFRLHYGIDPLFAARGPKKKGIAFMPRKNLPEARQVFNLLRCRGVLDGWELCPIDGLTETQVADRLAESALFFSFGYPEGCPLPPLEAMASGCAVVGYHGWGGREYFRKEFCWPVEVGDVVGFAREAEKVLIEARTDPDFLERLGNAAAQFVREHYSGEREEQDILAAWKSIVEVNGVPTSAALILSRLEIVPLPSTGKASRSSSGDSAFSSDDLDARIREGHEHLARRNLKGAVECWRTVMQLRPDPDLGFELGKVYLALGRHDEAIAALRQVVARRSDWYEAQSQLGVALGTAGKPSEAAPVFRTATELQPASPQAHHNLGVAYIQSGRLEEGATALKHALHLLPSYAEAHFNLGNALAALGRLDQAIEHYRQAVTHRLDYPEAFNNLGLRLTEAGKQAEAIPYLQQALRLRPGFVDCSSNLGIALEAVGRFDEAVEVLQEALRRDPKNADAHTNLANVYKARAWLPEAIAEYDISLSLRPDSPSTRYNRSLVLLLSGAYKAGWPEYEWRLERSRDHSRCPSDRPAWDGSSGQDRAILVWAEQGLGDVIQFVRYASLLKGRGFRVYLHVPGILHRLMCSLRGVDWLVAEGDTLPPHDLQCPLMSLPYRLGTTLESIPAAVPYLAADPGRQESWKKTLEQVSGRKVGLYWQGNPHHPLDRWRSLPLEQLQALTEVPDVNLVSLQQGPGREQIAGLAKNAEIVNLGEHFKTIDDLAAAIANMDLVVTVDTACAHLAGALSKPVWILLSAIPDWRWLLKRADTPWYPTARLFRQNRLGDWREPVLQVTDQLRKWFRHA